MLNHAKTLLMQIKDGGGDFLLDPRFAPSPLGTVLSTLHNTLIGGTADLEERHLTSIAVIRAIHAAGYGSYLNALSTRNTDNLISSVSTVRSMPKKRVVTNSGTSLQFIVSGTPAADEFPGVYDWEFNIQVTDAGVLQVYFNGVLQSSYTASSKNVLSTGLGNEFALLPTQMTAQLYKPGVSATILSSSWNLKVLGRIPSPNLAVISARLLRLTDFIDSLGSGEPWTTFQSLYKDNDAMHLQFAGMALAIVYALDAKKVLARSTGVTLGPNQVNTNFLPGAMTGGSDSGFDESSTIEGTVIV